MKPLYLFLIIIVTISCVEDKKIPSFDEKIFGNVKEIHTYRINQSDSNKIKDLDNIFYMKSIDSFDVSGNRVKRYDYMNSYNINGDVDDSKFKLQIMSIHNFKIDDKLGLIYSDVVDNKNKSLGYTTYSIKDNSIIYSNFFNENKQLKFKFRNILNEDNLFDNNDYYTADSIIITNSKFNYDDKGFVKSVVSKDSLNNKHTLNYKYYKFDNDGNWIKRMEIYEDKNLNTIILRDIFYYNN
jgi:hypothetical protein